MTAPRCLVDARALAGSSGPRGIGTYVRELLIGLSALGAGARLELLTFRDQILPPEIEDLGLPVHARLPRLKRRVQPVADPFLVGAVLARSRPDVYHAVEWAQPILARGVPVAVTVHDLIPFVFPRDYPWIRRERLLALRQLRRADAVVTPSAATARDVERLARVDPAAISVIPHGVDPVFRPAPAAALAELRRRLGLDERPYLLFPGTLDERKRRDVLAAVVRAARRETDVLLLVAGDQGGYRRAVDAALEREGIAAHARLPGFLRRDDLVAAYSGAACVVFPSAYEGFGLPLLEAQACGAPVVAFDNSAVAEVAGEAATLVPDGDAAAMSDAVTATLTEPEASRRARADRGRAWAAGFTWERSARAHLALYQTLASRRGGPGRPRTG